MEELEKNIHKNRLDIFLKLPRVVQEQIWLDLAEGEIKKNEWGKWGNGNL